jgi:hypothetical protein
MFQQFFKSQSRIQSLREGPEGQLLEGFVKELYREGYAETSARRHIRAAEHVVYWTNRNGTQLSGLTENVIERFDRHLNRCRCQDYGHADRSGSLHGARLFSPPGSRRRGQISNVDKLLREGGE